MNERLKNTIYKFFDVNFGRGFKISKGPMLYDPHTFTPSVCYQAKTNDGYIILKYYKGTMYITTDTKNFIASFFNLDEDSVFDLVVDWLCSVNNLRKKDLKKFFIEHVS